MTPPSPDPVRQKAEELCWKCDKSTWLNDLQTFTPKEVARLRPFYHVLVHRNEVMCGRGFLALIADLEQLQTLHAAETERRVWEEAACLRMAYMEGTLSAESKNDPLFQEFRRRAGGGG